MIITKTIQEEINLLDSFPENKYSKYYVLLIESRLNQKKTKLKTEAHHIFPRSIFGKSKENNTIVHLTHREHYVAHLLLWRMFRDSGEGEYKMQMALQCMSFMKNSDNKRVCTKMNSYIFSAFRKRSHEINSIKTKDRWDNDKEFRETITKSNQEYWADEDNRKKQSEKRKEHFKDEDNYKKMCKTNKELANTPEWKEKRSKKQKELSSDPEYTKKRIDAMGTPDAIEKSKASNKKIIDAMSKEERQDRFGRVRSEDENKAHGAKIKGRKKIINTETGKVKVVSPDTLEEWYAKGFKLKSSA